MSSYNYHLYNRPIDFSNQSNQPAQFVAVVGTVNTRTETTISGASGEHLKIFVTAGNSGQHEVDINIQSSDGSMIMVFVGEENLIPDVDVNPNEPPSFGIFQGANVQLSYQAIGLKDSQFQSIEDNRLVTQLEGDFAESAFVAIYGTTYNDGGPEGIHLIHLNDDQGLQNEDGAIAVYLPGDSPNQYTRRWYFFKFEEQSLG